MRACKLGIDIPRKQSRRLLAHAWVSKFLLEAGIKCAHYSPLKLKLLVRLQAPFPRGWETSRHWSISTFKETNFQVSCENRTNSTSVQTCMNPAHALAGHSSRRRASVISSPAEFVFARWPAGLILAELGNLAAVKFLSLTSNKLSGIPTTQYWTNDKTLVCSRTHLLRRCIGRTHVLGQFKRG